MSEIEPPPEAPTVTPTLDDSAPAGPQAASSDGVELVSVEKSSTDLTGTSDQVGVAPGTGNGEHLDDDPPPEERTPEDADSDASPLDEANCFSFLLMTWVSGLISTGYEESLELHHVWPTSTGDRHKSLYDQWWGHAGDIQHEKPDTCCYKLEDPEEIPTGAAFYRLVSYDFWLAAALYFVFVLASLIMPYLLYHMVKHLEATTGTESELWFGLALAGGLFAAQLGGALCQGLSDMVTVRGALKMRSVLVTSVYRHALQLSSKGRNSIDVGKMVNLMASDSTRFVEVAPLLNRAWSAPLLIFVIIGSIYSLVGWSAFVGLGFMLAFIPMTKYLGGYQMELQKARMKAADRRVKKTNEIMQGMKVLKLYGWEMAMRDIVLAFREEEVESLWAFAVTKALSTPVAQAVPPLASVVTFISYVLDGNTLTAATAFTTMSLFFLIRMPFVILPMAVPALAECLVALNRFAEYFKLEKCAILPRIACPSSGGSISIQHGAFKYESQITAGKEAAPAGKEAAAEAPTTEAAKEDRPTLEGINLKVSCRELCVVVGAVGSGKSSLIAAILDEIPRISGETSLYGTVAYADQTPYITNSTLKENILFGRPLDQAFNPNLTPI